MGAATASAGGAFFSEDLPLKALVREDASAQVWLGYDDTAFIARRHEVAGCAVAGNLGKAVAAMAEAAVAT